MPANPVPNLEVIRGTCTALFAHDLGFSIDLNLAQELLSKVEPAQRETIRHSRRSPNYFEYEPAPVRIGRAGTPMTIGRFTTLPTIEVLLYDFGAVSVSFCIPLSGAFEGLLPLSADLYENGALLAESRRVVEELAAIIQPAISKPQTSHLVEDYLAFNVQEWRGDGELGAWLDSARPLLAGVLRSESLTLSGQEVDEALSSRIAYTPGDSVLIDWNAAVVFGKDAADILAVLEFANVELLEMRFLDDQLDRALAQAYDATLKERGLFRGRGAELRRIARLQMDSAILFEGVNNALKLLGDPYLSRVYRLASNRLHLPDWDTSIIRKLGTLESIYTKFNDHQTTRRMEVLEWIIIVLIAFEIVWSVVR